MDSEAMNEDSEALMVMHCGNCDIEIPVDEKRCEACQMVADAYARRLTRISLAIDEEIDYARKSRAQQAYTALRLEAEDAVADFEANE